MFPRAKITRAVKVFSCIAMIFIVVIALCKIYGPSFNFQVTDSRPKGIYRIEPVQNIGRGDIVVLKVPKRILSYCESRRMIPRNLKYVLMKNVIALPGDIIKVSRAGCYVNGIYYGPVFALDSVGKPLPTCYGEYILKEKQYFLANKYEKSLDSRYFGPVLKEEITGKAKPWLVF